MTDRPMQIRLSQVLAQAQEAGVTIYLASRESRLSFNKGRPGHSKAAFTLCNDEESAHFDDQKVTVKPDGEFEALDKDDDWHLIALRKVTTAQWVPEYQPEPLKMSWAEGYRPLGDETGALFLVEGRIVGEPNESQLVCAQSSVEAERIFVLDLEEAAELDDEAIRQLEVRHGASYVIESCQVIGKLEAL